MAQVRSLAQRYASISKPRAVGGQSSYFTTLAKRNQAAEDDVVDNNYSRGLISAETYMNELTKRLTRTTNTPLQRANITQKITQVQESYEDAIMQNRYKAGEISARDMYNYENAKLSRMSAADSQAYQAQSAKVQGLLDSANKQERKDYRISEMNRISRMPEDSSVLLQQKANLYKKLRDMAIEDGDQQDATTLDTTYNNYQSSASRAQIYEQFQTSQNAIKEEFNPSTPTPEAGVQTQAAPATPIPAGVTPGTFGSPATSGAGVTGSAESSPAGTVAGPSQQELDAAVQQVIADGQERIAQAQEMLQSRLNYKKQLENDIAETTRYIEAAQVARDAYKRTGASDDVIRMDEQIKAYQRSINTYKEHLQEVNAGIKEAQINVDDVTKEAKYKIGYVGNQSAENLIKDAEQNLELELQMGKITKEQYLADRREIIQQKVNLYQQQADLYGEFDKTNPQAQAARDAQREEYKNLRIIDTQKNNAGRFELVRDLDGTVALKDVYAQKVAKTFEQDYVQDGSIWTKVQIPGLTNADGTPMSASQAIKEGYAWTTNNPEEMPFIAKLDANGVIQRLPIVRVDNKNEIYEKVSTLIDQGRYTYDSATGQFTSKPETKPTLLDKANEVVRAVAPEMRKAPAQFLLEKAQELPKLDLKDIYKRAAEPLQTLLKKAPIPTGIDALKSTTGIDVTKSPISQVPNITSAVGNVLGKARGYAGTLLDGLVHTLFRPIEKVTGKETPVIPEVVGKPFAKEIAQIWGSLAPDVYRTLEGENRGLDPNAVNINKDGSKDTGLLQINENTFNDFMRRKGNILRQNGITSYADMRDPVKNLRMAKIIHDEQGWDAWFGAPDDLRSPTPTATPTPTKAPSPTPTPTPLSGVDRVKQLNATNGWNQSPSSNIQATKPMNTISAKSSNSQGAPIVKTINNVPSVKQYDVNKGFVYQPIKAPTPPAPQPAPKPNIIQTIQKAAGNAVNTAKNLLGKLKFW